MTAPPVAATSVKLDECFSDISGIGFLADAGHCQDEGSARRRPAGYAFREQQPDTVAVYDCVSDSGENFVSNRGDCENKGTGRRLLGFALR